MHGNWRQLKMISTLSLSGLGFITLTVNGVVVCTAYHQCRQTHCRFNETHPASSVYLWLRPLHLSMSQNSLATDIPTSQPRSYITENSAYHNTHIPGGNTQMIGWMSVCLESISNLLEFFRYISHGCSLNKYIL